MARLIIKNGYSKGGSVKATSHLNNLIKYIATRDGVEKIVVLKGEFKATKKQKDLMEDIIQEFPNTKDSHEYEDYIKNPNRENASEFITISLEQHLTKVAGRGKYLDYIANRPRVEIIKSHGLFTNNDNEIVLSQVAKEISEHTGNVWTPIISLRREDAETTDFENAKTWKSLLSSKALVIADSLKIHPDNFKWFAAFHNESHHPHVHMVCYSTNPNEGYLTKVGIEKMKSSLATEIFKQELAPLYADKTKRRDELKKECAKVFLDLKYQLQNSNINNPNLEELISSLHQKLKFVTGKKQYGYLRPPLKEIVDRIVDEMGKDPSIKNAYKLWQELQNQIYNIYQDTIPEPLPLSQQKEFKSIKNMIIKEVLNLDSEMELEQKEQQLITNMELLQEEDEPVLLDDSPSLIEIEIQIGINKADVNFYKEIDPLVAEPKESNKSEKYHVSWSKKYKQARIYLFGNNDTDPDFAKALELLKQESESKNALAIFDMARMYADGLGVEITIEKAHELYATALFAFEDVESNMAWKYTEYRIGKMYAQGLGTEQDYEVAAQWFELSAEGKYKYAQYALGGLYYRGQGVEQDFERAFDLYLYSAKQGFPYAQYEVAKMYRDEIGTHKNIEQSNNWFERAFIGFEDLEEESHDDKIGYRLGAMLQKGVGTEVDISRAKEYFEKSAKLGNTYACYSFAKLILEDETSTAIELEMAIEYLKTASDGGNQFAQYSLAKVYLEEKYANKDISKAMDLLHLSAEQGNQFAQYQLGKLYLKGEGVPKDIVKALECLNKSAEQGNEFSKYQLGVLYLKGTDVLKDIDKGILFLTEVAEKGNLFALYQLGKLYLLGKDVLQDKETALKWLTLSATQGNDYAQFFIDNLDKWNNPSIGICTLRLFHCLANVFEDNIPQDSTTSHKQIDSKLIRKIREKKMAQGHKIGGHQMRM